MMLAVSLLLSLAVVPAASAADAPAGALIFSSRCAVCHGKDGVAKAAAHGSHNFSDPAWKASASLDELVQVITEGRRRMPSFKRKLSPEQIRSVASYVLTSLGTPPQ